MAELTVPPTEIELADALEPLVTLHPPTASVFRRLAFERDRLREVNAELLAALKRLLDMPAAIVGDDQIIEHRVRREEARAAIAKARGSGEAK